MREVFARGVDGLRVGAEMTQENQNSKMAVYELFMLVLCVYVLVTLAATTFLHLDEAIVEILDFVDVGICCVFMADFFYKLYSAEDRFKYVRTWGWIDFLSSIPVVGPLRWGRFARVIRILRLLRGVRSCKILVELLMRRRSETGIVTVLLIGLLTVVLSSIAILIFEGDEKAANIQSSQDALWWAFVTVTGVGYGDHYPVTSTGRAVAAVAMAIGLVLFGVFAGFAASWFMAPQEAEQDEELEMIRERLTLMEAHLNELVHRAEDSRLMESVEYRHKPLGSLPGDTR